MTSPADRRPAEHEAIASHVERVRGVREPSDRTVVDHHLAYTPPATDARVASAVIASSLISTPAVSSAGVRRLLNLLVEHPPSKALPTQKVGIYQGFCVERTTGFEPATLTLAR
jgi:hypothetical protein